MTSPVPALEAGFGLLSRCAALTGSIATGKSTVARRFADLGARIIDTDRIAREVVEPGRPALAAIKQAFGAGVIRGDGSLDRESMRSLIITDPSCKERLNAITHPYVAEEVIRCADRVFSADTAAPVIIDVPLLFEVGWDHFFSAIIVVYVTAAVQIERLMERDHLDRSSAEATVAFQIPIDDKRSLGTWQVNNSGSIEETHRQVDAIYPHLLRFAGGIGQ